MVSGDVGKHEVIQQSKLASMGKPEAWYTDTQEKLSNDNANGVGGIVAAL